MDVVPEEVVVGGGLEVVVVAGLVVLGVVDVDGAGVVVEDVGEPLAGVDVVDVEPEAAGGLVSSPLLCNALWISCWTVPTADATAAGVPPAPNEGSAFNRFRSLSSVATSAAEGCDFSVTTIWSASAVVMQAGQS